MSDCSYAVGFDDPQGYICSGCGVWVNAGDYHICPHYNPKYHTLQRLDAIIAHLEKINANLEKLVEMLK
jgi:hypothetical protein